MIKKRLLLVLLLLLVIVLSGCIQVSEETIKKTTGGVIICNIDYPCGNSDNICPEYYGADCKLEDPDCK